MKTLLWIITAPLWLPLVVIAACLVGALIYALGYILIFIVGATFFFFLYFFQILTL